MLTKNDSFVFAQTGSKGMEFAHFSLDYHTIHLLLFCISTVHGAKKGNILFLLNISFSICMPMIHQSSVNTGLLDTCLHMQKNLSTHTIRMVKLIKCCLTTFVEDNDDVKQTFPSSEKSIVRPSLSLVLH